MKNIFYNFVRCETHNFFLRCKGIVWFDEGAHIVNAVIALR